MRLAVTLVAVAPADLAAALEAVEIALRRTGATVGETDLLGPNAADVFVDSAFQTLIRERAEEALAGRAVDVCVQPAEGRRKRLLIADMDSTIINVECLDELADFAGVKDAVSAITERAMAGELAFEGALRERVAMLKGLGLTALQRCYDERVRLNPGAETLVRTMAAHGARCVLVSGGFTFFTGRVAAAAGFHADRANTLTEDGALLAGLVGEPILGREAKLAALEEEAAALGATPANALAVGDGANDLAMIEAAGLGIAYRAKPVVAAKADARVDHADLTALLYFQGYRREDFAA
ncbi:MAG: phosphoserine phosphatase SerB [Caulobacter sp.]|nr:phosphoserine phosphatase SerB [Caulobacter sp.]